MQNKVELIGWYGGDKAICRAAWTSTMIDVEAKTEEQIRSLIVNTLWNNASGKPHKTPFERGIVEFNIICDQASHIHLLKHRTANINGESARYKELKEDRMLLPEDWKNVKIVDRDNWSDEAMWLLGTSTTWYEALETTSHVLNELYHFSLEDASAILGRKRAKESSRFFKNMNSQITLSVMMNMSCFHNFYSLRADSAAQLEIQDIANKMIEAIENIEGNPFKYTLEAFKLSTDK